MDTPTDKPPGMLLRLALAGVCGALFFGAYGFCTARTASLAMVPTAFVATDHAIPFVPWTIVPYWSLDLLFVTAFLVQRDRTGLRTHTMRIVTGILAACLGFLFFPLRADAGALPDAGVWSPWFKTLSLFDKPFNQAPSLHIILLLIVWRAHLPAIAPKWRPAAYAWGVLIAISTVTTRQHGLVDLLAGAAIGVTVVNLIRAEPVFGRDGAPTPKMARRYAAGAAVARVSAYALAPATLLGAWGMAWVAIAAGLVAAAYAAGSTGIYAKRDGRVHWAAFWMLAPVLVPQRLAHRWLARKSGAATLTSDVSFGPIGGECPAGSALLDLTAEHDAPAGPKTYYACVPMNDLATFRPERVAFAVDEVERLRKQGPVHIVCALGLSRSATVAAAWLLRTGRAGNAREAASRVRDANPKSLPEPT